MAKDIMKDNISEILIAISDKGVSASRTAMLKAGSLRKIAARVYTTNMDEAPETIVHALCRLHAGQRYTAQGI